MHPTFFFTNIFPFFSEFIQPMFQVETDENLLKRHVLIYVMFSRLSITTLDKITHCDIIATMADNMVAM